MSTLEILIAFAMLTLTLTAVILVVFSNQSVSIDSQTNIEALSKAESLIESERALSRQDFSQVQSVAPTQDGIYQKSVTVTSIDSFTKKVVSYVSWTAGGRSLYSQLVTILTDFASLAGGSCNPTPLGDWKNPQHWDFIPTNLLPGNQSNGLGISDVKVYKQKLYLAANFPPNSGDTFFIFSLPADPSVAPTYLGSIDTNPSSSDGLNAIVLGTKGSSLYAYVANAHDANFQTCSQGQSCSQLQVVDVTTPASPSVVYSLKIPGVTGNMTSTGQAVGKSLYYTNGYVYLGLTKTASGPEFNIVDVSNPLAPTVVGSYAVGHTVESIYVSGNYAYLATDDNTKELTVLDISNKSAPVAVGSFDAPLNDSPGNNSGLGNAVFVGTGAAYLGRTYSFSNNDPEFYILNNSNPATTLPVTGSQDIGTGANNDSVLSIQVRSTLAFLMTGKQFQVWDISTPSSPAPWSSDGTTNTFLSLSALGGTGTSFSCSSNYFYTAIASSQGNHKDDLSIIGPGGIAPSIASAVHDASHNPISAATVGDTVHASAALSGSSGTPTGTVSFSYYAGSSCAGTATSLGTTALAGGVVDPSNTLALASAGSYSFRAHYNGSYAYTALDSSCMPLTVGKANQTITVTTHAPASATYGTTFSVAATADSGLPVAISGSGACSGSGSGSATITMTSGGGTCTVAYAQAGNGNYNAAPTITDTANALKATPILTWPNPAAIPYGTALSSTQLNASSGGVAGTFTYTPPAGTVLNVGANQTLSVHFVPTDTADYNTPSDKTASITVNKANQTITVNVHAPASAPFGASFSVAASANSGLAVAITTTGVCTIAGATVTMTSGSGTCVVHYNQAGNSNYNAATEVTDTTTAVKATPTNVSTTIYATLNNQATTTVAAGITVYDKFFMTGGTPAPTGTVTFVLYKNGTCNGGGGQQVQTTTGSFGAGVAQSGTFTTASANKGSMSYLASYPGDGNYNGVTAPCELLTVK